MQCDCSLQPSLQFYHFFKILTLMKNNETPIFINNQQVQQNTIPSSPITCSLTHPAQYACLNKICQKYAFMCKDRKCECRKEHAKCLVVELETVTSGLMGKVVEVKDLELAILQAVDRVIDGLSDFREKTILAMSNKFEFCGLNLQEKEFMAKLSKGQVQSITGKHLWQAHLNFSPESHITASKQSTILTIQKLFTQMETKIQAHCFQINKQIDNFQQQSTNMGLKQLSSKNQPIINSNLGLKFACSASKVVTSLEEFFVLQRFFAPKIIKKVKLLYQASNQKFQVNKFHQKCDNITDTLTLCQTQFGKKFGGYTPLSWASPTSYQYKTDQKQQSFIFSLTHRDKFTLIKKTHSIRQDLLYGPTFGNGQDIIIRNKANQASDSTANINTAYYNANYKVNDKASWERFCGNPHCSSFKLREWEVWRVEFE